MFTPTFLVSGLNCYVCESINGSNPECEDPMQFTVPVEAPCRQGKFGHEGLAFGHYCTKIKGIRDSDGVQIYIRRCSTQKLGGIPTHCGQFKIASELYRGCIATCTQSYCNFTPRMLDSFPILLLFATFIIIFYY